MNVLVFGPTGGTGDAVMRGAVARGHAVTVFSRSKVSGCPRGVQILEGDVFDGAAVARATVGRDAVISALGTKAWRHTDVCSVGTRHIVAGMQAAGVRRLIVVSSIGAGDSGTSSGPATQLAAATILKRALADKTVMEDELRASGLDWIVARPTMLTNGKPSGEVRAVTDGSIRGGTIARADVAGFLLAQLTSDAWLHRTPVITSA